MEKHSLVSKFYVTHDPWKGTAYKTHSYHMNHQEIMESENKLIQKFTLHASIYVIPEVMAKVNQLVRGWRGGRRGEQQSLGAMEW